MRNKKLIIIFSVLCVFALLIVFNSVLFSIQHITPYCYNASDDALENEVVEHSNIKKGKSIFLLDKNEVIVSVERNISNVKVINIEKKFPNQIYINYIKIDEYYKIESDGKYYYLSNQGSVTRIIDKADALDDNLILIKTKGEVSAAEGEQLVFENTYDETVMVTILSVLERLLYREELLNLFEFIDFTKAFIYFKIDTGVYWELQSLDNAANKLRFALDTYSVLGTASDEAKSGTMIITGNEKPRVDYRQEDRYTNGV